MNGNQPLPALSVRPPAWAEGCGKCEYGLLGDVARGRKVYASLYIVRAFQARWKMIAFCKCRAGKAYRQYLLRVWKRIESKEDYISPLLIERIKDELMADPPPLPSHSRPLAISPYEVVEPPLTFDDADGGVPTMHFDEAELIPA